MEWNSTVKMSIMERLGKFSKDKTQTYSHPKRSGRA